jgi:PIN domain nuclease of toxin-antitoxin system
MNESPLLLLDTHIWLWFVEGDRRLSRRARQAVDRAAEAGKLRLSVLSVWEIGMLEANGRLVLNLDCMEWVRTALRLSRVVLAPFTPEIAVESTRLPGDFHADPADQLIVATCRALSATLVTQDGLILRYARGHHVSVLAG